MFSSFAVSMSWSARSAITSGFSTDSSILERYFSATEVMYLLTKVFFSLSFRGLKFTLRLNRESSSGGNLPCTSVLGVFEAKTMV